MTPGVGVWRYNQELQGVAAQLESRQIHCQVANAKRTHNTGGSSRLRGTKTLEGDGGRGINPCAGYGLGLHGEPGVTWSEQGCPFDRREG